jgi:hypothetical protein
MMYILEELAESIEVDLVKLSTTGALLLSRYTIRPATITAASALNTLQIHELLHGKMLLRVIDRIQDVFYNCLTLFPIQSRKEHNTLV